MTTIFDGNAKDYVTRACNDQITLY